MGNQKNNQHVWPVAATSEKEGETKKAINLCSLAVMTASKNPKEQSTCVACCRAASRKKNNQPVAKWQKKNNQPLWPVVATSNKNGSGLLGKQKKNQPVQPVAVPSTEKQKKNQPVHHLWPQARNKLMAFWVVSLCK